MPSPSYTPRMQKESTRKYEIRRPLGKGGFGTVYLAHLVGPGGFEKPVALKMLHAEMEEIDEIAMRMRDEARMMGLLNHRAIVKVDGLVILEGRWTIVMEYVKGVELADLISMKKATPPGVAMEIVGEVASALDSAYSEPAGPEGQALRVLHRDIKPANIQLTAKGEVKVLDFGIARAEFANREAATEQMMFGSKMYMAPERFDLLDTHAGDIYALGLVMFELLTSKGFGKAQVSPKRHDKSMEAAQEQLDAAQVPPQVCELFRRMMEYEHDERPSAKEVARQCRGLVRSLGGVSLIDWSEETIPPILDARPEQDNDRLSGRTLLEVPLKTKLKEGDTLGSADESKKPAPVPVEQQAPPPPLQPPPAQPEMARETTASLALQAGKATIVGGTLMSLGAALFAIIALLAGIVFLLLNPLGDDPETVASEDGPPVAETEIDDVEAPEATDGTEDSTDPAVTKPRKKKTASSGTAATGDATADAELDPEADPDAVVPGPVDIESTGCGNEASLSSKAAKGTMSNQEIRCLETAALAAAKQTDRKRMGRIVLINHSTACRNGVNCGAYEVYQREYFDDIDRSDAEMMYQFAKHLHNKTPRTEARNKEVMLWARRSLDNKSHWKSSQYVLRVNELNEINARAAYDQWSTASKSGSSKTAKYQNDARTATIDWLSYLNQLGKDSSEAERLCESVSGTDEICKKQATPKAKAVVMTFVSVPIGAKVHIDGVAKGNAPLTTEIKPGGHELKFVYDDGKTGTQAIEVGPKEPARYIWRSAEDKWVTAF